MNNAARRVIITVLIIASNLGGFLYFRSKTLQQIQLLEEIKAECKR